jgi:hypothetical protein
VRGEWKDRAAFILVDTEVWYVAVNTIKKLEA